MVSKIVSEALLSSKHSKMLLLGISHSTDFFKLPFLESLLVKLNYHLTLSLHLEVTVILDRVCHGDNRNDKKNTFHKSTVCKMKKYSNWSQSTNASFFSAFYYHVSLNSLCLFCRSDSAHFFLYSSVPTKSDSIVTRMNVAQLQPIGFFLTSTNTILNRSNRPERRQSFFTFLIL